MAKETISHISNSYNIVSTNARIKGTEPLHRLLDPNAKDHEFVPLQPTICQQVFEGTQCEQSHDGSKKSCPIFLMPPTFYLTERKQRIVKSSHKSHDIDSFLTLPICLSVAKGGLKV